MAIKLTKEHKSAMERAHEDPKFRTALLKELIRIAMAADPKLLDKALDNLK